MINDDRLTPETIKRLYPTLSTHTLDHQILVRDISMWIKGLPIGSSPTIIDFGCGRFTLLQEIQQLFQHPVLYGIDFNPLAESHIPDGITFIHDDLHRLKDIVQLKGVKYNLGLFSSVLEHVLNPRAVIKGLRNLMADKSFLYIELPVIDAMTANTSQIYEIVNPQHIHYFTSNNLVNLFRQCGLDVTMQDTDTVDGFPRGRYLLMKRNVEDIAYPITQFVDDVRKSRIDAANKIISLIEAGKRIIIWGVSMDLYFMARLVPKLNEYLLSGTIILADTFLKGSFWLGNEIIAPTDITSYEGSITILSVRLRRVQDSILRQAHLLGIKNIINPFTLIG